MDRRSFIRIGMASAAASIIAPGLVLANPLGRISKSDMAGGLFYTKESPGRWKKKAGPHSPILEKIFDGVRVTTGHPMKPNKHWIVKHVLLDSKFNFIAENIFDPNKDKAAISDFEIPNHKGTVYALSVCNLHDTWLTAIEI